MTLILRSAAAKLFAALAVMALLMAMVSGECSLWPGDPSLSACSAASMFRLNAQRTGRSPFAGPGQMQPDLYEVDTLAMPIVGPSYLGDSDPDIGASPFFVETCTTCPGALVMERPFNSSGYVAAAQMNSFPTYDFLLPIHWRVLSITLAVADGSN